VNLPIAQPTRLGYRLSHAPHLGAPFLKTDMGRTFPFSEVLTDAPLAEQFAKEILHRSPRAGIRLGATPRIAGNAVGTLANSVRE
jgi:hypothetical protein